MVLLAPVMVRWLIPRRRDRDVRVREARSAQGALRG
jgi:hypothetical protein